ncbi:hypothetical protein LWI29_014916 [Acer saccharum]|uniref:DYW domain-containing protein n=1 Tax=Acer saccharum TaxID=4024 RepID=A0AA39STX1_ACESA|nr:hypothetical protein LWI29_014916 [Acer saccharum]
MDQTGMVLSNGPSLPSKPNNVSFRLASKGPSGFKACGGNKRVDLCVDLGQVMVVGVDGSKSSVQESLKVENQFQRGGVEESGLIEEVEEVVSSDNQTFKNDLVRAKIDAETNADAVVAGSEEELTLSRRKDFMSVMQGSRFSKGNQTKADSSCGKTIDIYSSQQSYQKELGKQVHAYMTRIGFDPYSFAASALVHMYSKCGNVENAKRVFDGIPRPDIVPWTALITGYARNSLPDKALEYFDLLLKSGTQPDHIVFVGVLSACTHAGLVDKGLEYFRSIKEKHGLTHTADHYACIVDLLARSGRFEETEGIISRMPTKPNKFFWVSLLGGCRIHGNLELAKHAVEALFEIEPENPATYITMNNIYATASRWSDVAKIRKRMGVQLFLVGDTSYPQSKEMHEFLVEISKKMKEEGYVPDTNFVLQDVEDEEQKEQNLSYHSEMLAVAFGIIATPPETIIKVFKNLRTCVDCHTAIKFISKMYTRRIFVRDSNRFHHFKDGNCSCGDSW